MGIVVTIAMLIGLIVIGQKMLGDAADVASQTLTQRVVAVLLLVFGFWNAAWYGIQHMGELWGQAALVSGLAMIGGAAWILSYLPGTRLGKLIFVILLASFLLYAVTLVQLNLGYPILK